MGCSKRASEEGATDVDLTPALFAQQHADTQLVGPTAIRLRDGSCLDANRVPAPWKQELKIYPGEQPLGLHIAAKGIAVGIIPYERVHFRDDFLGRPHDGKVHLEITGWTPTPLNLGHRRIPSPTTFQDDIAKGYFRKDFSHPTEGGLDVFLSTLSTEIFYTDHRKYTACTLFGPLRSDSVASHSIICVYVSKDSLYDFSVELDRSEAARISEKLERIASSVSAMRGACPVPGHIDPRGKPMRPDSYVSGDTRGTFGK